MAIHVALSPVGQRWHQRPWGSGPGTMLGPHREWDPPGVRLCYVASECCSASPGLATPCQDPGGPLRAGVVPTEPMALWRTPAFKGR